MVEVAFVDAPWPVATLGLQEHATSLGGADLFQAQQRCRESSRRLGADLATLAMYCGLIRGIEVIEPELLRSGWWFKPLVPQNIDARQPL